MNELINNILIWGALGSTIFLVLILIIAFTGIAAATRNEAGQFKKKLTWKSAIGFSIFSLFVFGLLHNGNIALIECYNSSPSLIILWLNSFGIFFFVHLFDLLVLDYLIIVKWHPSFLKLPDTDYYNIMKPHVDGFIRGIPFGIVVSFLIALFSYSQLS